MLERRPVSAEALVEIEKYGLGTVRTLDDYQRFSGIDFARRTISHFAPYGRVVPQWLTRRGAKYRNLQQPIERDRAMPPRIFVHIAAYRDPETPHTINDLLNKASRPEKISIGLVQQVMPGDAIVPPSGHVRSIQIDARETQGTCWARSRGYTLYGAEDYILQIDSHMRFAERWDEKMLAELAACPSEKPMLTTYAPGYEPPDTIVSNGPTALRPQSFNASGCLLQYGHPLYNPPSSPVPTSLMSGHFLFARAQWIHEVPYDPHLYHTGEETTLAVRLWTHGWDLFSPRMALVWHQYTRDGQPKHWTDYPEKVGLVSRGYQRTLHLLGMTEAAGANLFNLADYGFGTVRTLSDYQHFSGIDFRQRTITAHALAGGLVGEWIILNLLDQNPSGPVTSTWARELDERGCHMGCDQRDYM